MEDPFTARERFLAIKPVLEGRLTVTAAAAQVGRTRQALHSWLKRFEQNGLAGLETRPPVARSHPHALSAEVVELIIGLRLTQPTWGPKKLQEIVARRFPTTRPPARSTIGDLLVRNNLVVKKRRRKGAMPRVPREFEPVTQPNDTWCTDFKGHWALGNGRRCHPLTISDSFSRMLLRCHGFHAEKAELCWPVFEAAFREYGLPRTIRFDSGNPFASQAPGGLSRLSIRFIRLGIHIERTDPATPSQNGRLERLHRTLKAEVERKYDLARQQPELDRWRRHYNEERPHEALGQAMPIERYRPSPRRYPRSALPEIEYPEGFVRLHVTSNGCIQWGGVQSYVCQLLAGEHVGVRQVTGQHHEVRFGPVLLGTLDAAEPGRSLYRYG